MLAGVTGRRRTAARSAASIRTGRDGSNTKHELSIEGRPIPGTHGGIGGPTHEPTSPDETVSIGGVAAVRSPRRRAQAPPRRTNSA